MFIDNLIKPGAKSTIGFIITLDNANYMENIIIRHKIHRFTIEFYSIL